MTDIPSGPTDIRVITDQELHDARDGIKNKFPHPTVCNVVREIYDLVNIIQDEVLREQIQSRCLMVFCYVKRMDNKLCEYKDRLGN
jgi:hypothetical protein